MSGQENIFGDILEDNLVDIKNDYSDESKGNQTTVENIIQKLTSLRFEDQVKLKARRQLSAAAKVILSGLPSYIQCRSLKYEDIFVPDAKRQSRRRMFFKVVISSSTKRRTHHLVSLQYKLVRATSTYIVTYDKPMVVTLGSLKTPKCNY